MNETKSWTWFIIAGAMIFILLSLHMITMHLDGILGWFNPAGGKSVEWANVIARAKIITSAVMYILLLGTALYHGLYGLRTILIELNIGKSFEKAITRFLLIIGAGLFIYGAWAAVKFQVIATLV